MAETKNFSEQAASPKSEPPRKIYRSQKDKVIAGVCGGLAHYFNIDVIIIRIVWICAVLFGGFGVLVYILAWIILPEGEGNSETETKKKSTNSGLLWGIFFIVIGGFFLVRHFDWFDYYPFHYWRWQHWLPWNFRFNLILPTLIIIIGAIFLYNALKKDKESDQESKSEKSGGKTMEKRLTRSTKDKMVAGVCGGLALYFNVDPSLVRIGFALMTLVSGGFIGVVAYIVMMIVIPEETSVGATETKTTAPTAKAAKPVSNRKRAATQNSTDAKVEKPE